MKDIIRNLNDIHSRIAKACVSAGRTTDEIQLLLATKTVSVDRIKVALANGETVIGENKVQELTQKAEGLQDSNVERHFIGHLQTNKIKEVVKYASCIQSVDRINLVEKLDQRLQYEGRAIDILVQVNTSFEASKFGLPPDETLAFVKVASKYDTIRIKGLMTIGLFNSDAEKVRNCFQLLQNIRRQLIEENISNVSMDTLSMGMSNDMEVAIEEGSTMVRVGSAIFGSRIYPDSYYWNEK